MDLVLKHGAVNGGWGHGSLLWHLEGFFLENSTQVKSGFLLDCAVQENPRMSHREAELDFIKTFLTSIQAWVLEHTQVWVCASQDSHFSIIWGIAVL